MAVFRIDKTKNYTVMANYHLRDTSLSLKAKGLLSLMLSLPEGWDYTTKGLACICKDGVDSICSTVKELENAGYVQRRRLRNELGHLTEVEYTILEKPVRPDSTENPPKSGTAPKRDNPVLEKPVLGNPVLDIPEQEEPEQENPAQLNIQESITEKLNTDLSNTDSFFPSAEAVPSTRQAPLTDGRTEREKIREQIEYPIPEKMPILQDLYDQLRMQEEKEAQHIATALEIYVSGSLSVFNHRTDVDIHNRIVCYDIRELGKQLKKIGMHIVQDQVWNRVTANRFHKVQDGNSAIQKATRYYMDEFHLLLKEEQTAAYSIEIWKRFRKWGGIPTGITQNVKDLLSSREIENIFMSLALDTMTASTESTKSTMPCELLLFYSTFSSTHCSPMPGALTLIWIFPALSPARITASALP